MRNFIFLALITSILFISGCSKSESGSTFSPPSWIQGSWLETLNPTDKGYKFIPNEIYLILNEELIELGISYDATSSEIKNTANEYSFEYTLNDELQVVTCVPGSTTNVETIDCTVDLTTTVYISSDFY